MNKNHIESKHYTPEEVLQILIDLYNFQAYFCLDIEKGHNLTFQTTIGEWRKICKLKDPINLAGDFQNFFYLENQSDLSTLLSAEKNTLSIFCNYIVNKAIKKTITPIVSLGTTCQEAAIFKT